jgi:hypothetical protein
MRTVRIYVRVKGFIETSVLSVCVCLRKLSKTDIGRHF